MDFPDFVWSASDIIGSASDYTEKMAKYLHLVAGECNAESGIVWVPSENGELKPVNTEVSDPIPFMSSAVNAIEKNVAMVTSVGGLYVMSLPVSEKTLRSEPVYSLSAGINSTETI